MTAQPRRPALPPAISADGRERRASAPDRNEPAHTDRSHAPKENVRAPAREHAGPPARTLPRRTGAPYRRPDPAARTRPDKTKRRFVQLIACLVIFGVALAIKIIAPGSAEDLKKVFADNIGGGLDYKTAFSTVGEALLGGNVEEVWGALSTALFGGGGEEADVRAPDEKDAKAVGTASAPGEKRRDPPAGRALGNPANDTAAGMLGRVVQLSGWEVPLSDADAMDDTAPVPFGLAVPVNVDYARYELPFETRAPVSGPVSSDFGYRDHPITGELQFHYGLDIAAPLGTDIHCFANGVVVAAGVSDSFGNYIRVRHDGTYSTFYAHCGRILAKKGQSVKGGDVIARVGMSGMTTGPHLHLEIRRGGTLLDPKYHISTEAPA